MYPARREPIKRPKKVKEMVKDFSKSFKFHSTVKIPIIRERSMDSAPSEINKRPMNIKIL